VEGQVQGSRFGDREFYTTLGLRCGIEMHRQLHTDHKLFCRCPVRPYSQEYHAEILRHMRPTLSELGEYDPTALMEFKTRKEIVYRLNRDTVCTYEMDDAPPFGLNRDALHRGLVIARMLNLNLVDEVHIARKQYLDGSIPTGFQRTCILGVNGWIRVEGRRIGIRQLGLEEDACREVSDHGHRRTYLTDRLSIPLIEIVTEAEMHTPWEAFQVGSAIRRLCHLSGQVRTGHGRARQDVNVSIRGGDRVEIKGVSTLRLIPALVHYEALRQKALLDLRDALKARGVVPADFSEDRDVTALARRFVHPALRGPWTGGVVARAILLRKCSGFLSRPLAPGRTFASEVSDRVRVIACLDRMPNLAHSDDPEAFSLSPLFDQVRQAFEAGAPDAVVIVAGPAQDVQTAIGEVRLRLTEALVGVPRETRKSLPDGTTCFERMLPGPDRMYPDTDLPPIVLGQEDHRRAREETPEPNWDKEDRWIGMGCSREQAYRLLTEDAWPAFEALVDQVAVRPSVLAWLLLDWIPGLRRRGASIEGLTVDRLREVLSVPEGVPQLRQKDAAGRVGLAVGRPPRFLQKPDPRKDQPEPTR